MIAGASGWEALFFDDGDGEVQELVRPVVCWQATTDVGPDMVERDVVVGWVIGDNGCPARADAEPSPLRGWQFDTFQLNVGEE